ncbi:MAG: hypothetical protein Q7T31_11310 [Dietzia sp.]|uniref:hypothetical protein n=1 Tax=Dietzia TaxID=37914 RepID=UPI0015F7ECF1|nr:MULTISPECIES: hypothetical protein [Dietzia]MBB1040763.1 hypothetical protein [Dietzia sp. Cai40]MBB1045811.1 hypothetical protein [Dietzia sp. DQ11-44]MBC7295017.1 hypothetical protein [Dietzia sp.]MCT1516164.1 hypothetical protein [Dietzia cercidiphylli]MDO8394960.1 hypothetical protein [Dietzia sp.]
MADDRADEGATSGDRTPSVDETHRRPPGATDAEVEAAGTATEALEYVERARGHLYDLHQLIGRADILYQQAADQLEAVGRTELAELIRTEMVGVNVLHGRWTFQMVEEFDDGFWTTAREVSKAVRDEVTDGRRHVYEAELKERNRSAGTTGHEATPRENL